MRMLRSVHVVPLSCSPLVTVVFPVRRAEAVQTLCRPSPLAAPSEYITVPLL